MLSSFSVSSTWMLIGTFCRFSVALLRGDRDAAELLWLALVGAGARCASSCGILVAVRGERRREARRGGSPRRAAGARARGVRCAYVRVAVRLSSSRLPECCRATESIVVVVMRIAIAASRIASQRGPERGLQRIEPGLVVPPMIHAVAKDRLAHLLGAGGAHRRARSRRTAGTRPRTAGRSSRAGGALRARCPRPCVS